MLNRFCTPPRRDDKNSKQNELRKIPYFSSAYAKVERRLGLDDEDSPISPTDCISWRASSLYCNMESKRPSEGGNPGEKALGLDQGCANQSLHALSSSGQFLLRCSQKVESHPFREGVFSGDAVGVMSSSDLFTHNDLSQPADSIAVTRSLECWQTPEVPRMGAQSSGDGCSITVAPFLLYTPQIEPGRLSMRNLLDTELDFVNSAHRMEPLPSVTTLMQDCLFIGGFPDEQTAHILRENNITHVINCCAHEYRTDSAIVAEFYVHELECYDRADYLILHHDYDIFFNLLTSILFKKEKVFVHCIGGINRSVTLCCAFLMEKLRLNPIEVVKLFRANGRMHILDNIGFRHQLVDFYFQVVASQNNDEEF